MHVIAENTSGDQVKKTEIVEISSLRFHSLEKKKFIVKMELHKYGLKFDDKCISCSYDTRG